MNISYTNLRLIREILKIKFNNKEALTHKEILELFDEFWNSPENYIGKVKGTSLALQQSEARRVFEGFVEYLLYRNIANYDSMVLLTSNKGMGKSSFAIMLAWIWCKFIGIKFDPDRHIAYTNQQVQDKIDKLEPFEPLICLSGDSLIKIRVDGVESSEKIKYLVGRNDYEVRSYNIEKDEFEWVKPEKCVKTGVSDGIYEVELVNGQKVYVTKNHKLLTTKGYKVVQDLTEEDEIIVNSYKCEKCGTEFIPHKNDSSQRKLCKDCAFEKRRNTINENRRKKYKENEEYKNKRIKEVTEYRKENPVKVKKYYDDWRKENKDKIKNYRDIKKQNEEYKLRLYLSCGLSRALQKRQLMKKSSILNYIGCSLEFLREYIEKQFKENMNWENYGEWHIDHIKPQNSFNFKNEEEIKTCYNYNNLQPLWARENIIKSDKYESN